jgi:glyoxylase-like metal-dependent hydrolase (beta-lactamase superfamily II)
MLHTNVAEGIHRLEVANTNLYIVEHSSGILLVDAGLPRVWPHLLLALKQLAIDPGQLSGVLLTHGHFDHVGGLPQILEHWTIPVWVHPGDAALVAHPYSYDHERFRFGYPLRYPRSIPIVVSIALAGALEVTGTSDTIALDEGLSLPGDPVIVPTPGHTHGHIAVHFPDRDAVIVGDSLVTLDPYTGETGPQIVAGAATADSAGALGSLDALRDTDATLVLPGHGWVWNGGITSAVAAAKARGAH